MARRKRLPSGMSSRRYANGTRTYFADVYVRGRRQRQSYGTDLARAKREHAAFMAHVAGGRFGELDNDYSVDALRRAYLTYVLQQRPKSHATYARDLGYILGRLSANLVSDITPGLVIADRKQRLSEQLTYKHTAAKPVSARTINKQVMVLKLMFNWGVRVAKVIGSNPIADLPALPEAVKAKRRRSLTVDEAKGLLDHSPEHWRRIWHTLLTTGMRIGELSRLRFEDIDWDGGEIDLPGAITKNGKPRSIPMDDALAEIIRKQQAEAGQRGAGNRWPMHREKLDAYAAAASDLVFVTQADTALWRNEGNIVRALRRRLLAAGIPVATPAGDIDVHSLRVTACTLMIDGGANPKAVSEILGHATVQFTLDLYARATERGKRSAIAANPLATVTSPDRVLTLNGHDPGTRSGIPLQRSTQSS